MRSACSAFSLPNTWRGSASSGSWAGFTPARLQRQIIPIQGGCVEQPAPRGDVVIADLPPAQASQDVFLHAGEARRFCEHLRPLLAQPDDLIQRVHSVDGTAGSPVERFRVGPGFDVLSLFYRPPVRPGDHPGERSIVFVQRNQAVQGAADADPARFARQLAGLFQRSPHAGDHGLEYRFGVLLLPFSVGALAGVFMRAKTEQARALVDEHTFAAAGAYVNAHIPGFHTFSAHAQPTGDDRSLLG